MKRQRAEISSNVISHIKSAHPIEMWRSNKLGIKEKISRGKFPRLIFSCPVPSGLPHRSHCVPMNMNRCGYRVSFWLVLTKKMLSFPPSARKGMFAGETLAGFPLLFNNPRRRRAICETNRRGTNQKRTSKWMSSFDCQVASFRIFFFWYFGDYSSTIGEM